MTNILIIDDSAFETKQLRTLREEAGHRVAAAPDDGLVQAKQLIQCADDALYKAKKKGRDRVEGAALREIGTES